MKFTFWNIILSAVIDRCITAILKGQMQFLENRIKTRYGAACSCLLGSRRECGSRRVAPPLSCSSHDRGGE
jgi:hypothetical protein